MVPAGRPIILAVRPLEQLRNRAGAGRDVARRVVFGPAGKAIERLGLADPAFRAYEKLLARRAGALPARGTDGLPLPPAHLQILVAGHASAGFEQDGANGADSIRQILRRTGGDIDGCRAVLDFGAGCARIARHWAKIEGPEWHACDYNPTLVAWCNANLPFLQMVQNTLEPPLPYPDERFDLVYAYSVFTHLPEPLQHAWIAELLRVLEPGGRLIVTTHGDATRPLMEPALAEPYERGEFAVRFSGTPGSNLCSAFHPEPWVRQSLAPHLEELDLQRGGAPGLGHQDIWTFRKPA
jgi:SAM-dependent methyltransferase